MNHVTRLATAASALLAASPSVLLGVVIVLAAVLFCPWREPFERLLALLHGHPPDTHQRRKRPGKRRRRERTDVVIR